MEKLMTTFAKTKDDIIKDALKEAKQDAVSETKKVSLKSPKKTQKSRTLKTKKTGAFPQQKSILALSEHFHQSCADLENLITAGLHGITSSVSQKHANLVRKLKDDLLRHVNNHRYLDQILVVAPTDKTMSESSHQKQEANWSENFHQSCSDLEHLIQTGFETLASKVSRKHVSSINILKEELLDYLNIHHRQIHAQLITPKTTKKKTHPSDVISKESAEKKQETPEIISPVAV